MMVAIALILLAAAALLLIRLFAGPTVYDRVLALNSFATKTILILGLTGIISGQLWFVDIALVYVLVNFIANIAIMKFVRYGSLRPALSESNNRTDTGRHP